MMGGAAWVRVGAILGGLAVVAGTFGAHGLEGKVEPGDLETFEVGVRYQMYHAFALIAVGLLAMRTGLGSGSASGASRALSASGWLFLVGSIVFPGSLYLLVLAGGTADWLGMIAPIGGLALIAGWFAMASACRADRFGPGAGAEELDGAGVGAEDPQRVA
ncbi:DUF423 domain-containing protein [Tautonia plasticadhaerens]|uniref:DUF423 domain-containing protein n=1 Tax=Tautonia plasticadhaerens TaxID=2527974 RepID=A0A518H093_9BACT|nr:DUF423 domain-containing protein [Tautonia plasticadhaerens]QDV34252.1 hypothetical protein ElP_21370 [Tautonia plasticadhaerens]